MTTDSTETYFVGWTPDLRTFQLLGPQTAEKPADAIRAAAKTHGQEGRYIALPGSELTQRDVTFDKEPVLSKPTDDTQASVDPTTPTP